MQNPISQKDTNFVITGFMKETSRETLYQELVLESLENTIDNRYMK